MSARCTGAPARGRHAEAASPRSATQRRSRHAPAPTRTPQQDLAPPVLNDPHRPSDGSPPRRVTSGRPPSAIRPLPKTLRIEPSSNRAPQRRARSCHPRSSALPHSPSDFPRRRDNRPKEPRDRRGSHSLPPASPRANRDNPSGPRKSAPAARPYTEPGRRPYLDIGRTPGADEDASPRAGSLSGTHRLVAMRIAALTRVERLERCITDGRLLRR